MNVLFLESNPRWIYGLPKGFEDAGHTVKILEDFNDEAIRVLFESFKPDLVMSLGWTQNYSQKKLQLICKYIKSIPVPYVFWATEDPGYTHTFTIPFIQKVRPDFVFTICPERVAYYNQLGFKSSHLDFGYHYSIHHPVACEEQFRCKIAVVANAYPKFLSEHTDHFRLASINNLILPLLKENIKVDFWGRDWDKMASILNVQISDKNIHGCVPYTDANKIYSSADIILGIQNQQVHSQVCQRTYEILASGGFLLTSETKGVKKLFDSGKDLITSSSPEETLKLVNYYLTRPEERKKIQGSGRAAVEKHSYKHRAEYIINILRKYKIITTV